MTRSKLVLTFGLAAIYLFLIAPGFATDTRTTAAPAQRSKSAPFLWKVEGPHPSWLFGTIHLDDPSVATLPASVTRALDSSHSFHPEIELGADMGVAVAAKLFSPNTPDLDKRLPPALWRRVEHTGAALGLPTSMLERLTPGFAALLFSAPPDQDAASTVDGRLYERAKAHALTIAALETVDEQLGLFEKLSDEAAIAALTDALDEVDAGRPHDRKLLAAYTSGEESQVVAMVEEEFAHSPADRALAELLLYNRNRVMADRLVPHLQAGSAFVAIGAAHLTGPRSVIELLRARGWKITRIVGP